MQKKLKANRLLSAVLCAVMLISVLTPAFTAVAEGITFEITKDDAVVTETVEVQEYRSVQLSYSVSGETPDGTYVTWESNLPLLAGVDDSGKVTGYDYSKAAIIQLWLDEEVRSTPVIGGTMASAIETALNASGIDLETANTDMIVTIVSAINSDLGASLKKRLDNMNVVVTATLYDADGNKLASDKIDVLVTKSTIANFAPTGVHITNKKTVPTTVAVGAQVQLYGACTPVRLKQGIKWTVGGNILDRESANHATVSSDGLVTFTSAGNVTVRVNPESNLYAAFSDTVKFTVVDPSKLPVTDFTIAGDTSVKEGDSIQLSLGNVVPAGAYTGSVAWSSSDPTIATVDQNGVVTGLDGGNGLTYTKTVTITAVVDGVTKNIEVTVRRNLSTSIAGVEISGDTAVGIGDVATYTATVSPTRINSNKDVIRNWGLLNSVNGEKIYANNGEANNGIAKIDSNGNLTGLSSGEVNIFVDAVYNGTTVTDTFTVKIGKAITDFSISGAKNISENDTLQLSINTGSITPSDYDPSLLDTVVWSSADSSIASVDQNGLVKGLDGGESSLLRGSSKTTTITATIGGVSRSVSITVNGKRILSTYTGGEIIGPENVVVDFPYTYTSVHTPERMKINKQTWGINEKADNTQNSFVSVDNSSGRVTGLSAGETTIYTRMQSDFTGLTNQTLSKKINVVEITPKSITVTAPTKYEYLEGDTQLDLSGMEVKLTYDKEDLKQYYPNVEYTDEQMTVVVNDYTVSEINPSLLDNEQYIVVTVSRAGKDMRAIFPIVVKSKQVDTIEITESPKYQYLEGATELDLSGLKVQANYLNADSEFVNDYTVSTEAFDPTLLNVEQNITVTYSHAGRSASATFPIIVYGIPVVSVSANGYNGGWTKDDVTFTLDSTHKIDGITYYCKTANDENWTALEGNTLTVDSDTYEVYYFKAVNGKGIDGTASLGYQVSIDKITPVFTLNPSNTELTNTSYEILINIGTIGASGINTITLNGKDITGNTAFTADKNGTYTVKITSLSGVEAEESIEINNIDKTAPTVTDIELKQANSNEARIIDGVSYFNSELEFILTASDEGVAGIDFIEYRFVDENGNALTDWAKYDETNKPTQSDNFKGRIEVRAYDKAKNVSEVKSSENFTVDTQKPSDVIISATDDKGSYENDTWTSTDVNITLSSSAYSGIYKYYYRVDGGEWTELTSDSFKATQHGITNYEFKALSYSGNESEITAFTVKIDKVQPVVRVDFEGTFGRWTSGDVKFSFSSLNECISGVTYYYDNGNGWVEITTGEIISLNDNVNSSYVFKAVNGAGVESNPSDSYRVMIDNVAPSIAFTPEVTEKTNEEYTVSFNVSAGNSGIKSVSVNGEDVTDKNEITVSENGKYVFVLTGNNGLTSTEILTIDNFVESTSSMPILFVVTEGTIGRETDKDVIFRLSSPNAQDGVKYYYNTGSGWVLINSDSLTVSENTDASYYFKAVNPDGTESYQSPAYRVIIDKTVKNFVVNDGSALFVDRTVSNTYMVGLNTKANTVEAVVSGLQNDSTTVIVTRNDAVLSAGDRVGTGCVVKLVSKNDPSIVYEIATVILYGDVNGDGLVDGTDHEMMNSFAFYDANNIEANTVYFFAADLDGDGAIDGFDLYFQDGIMSGERYFNQAQKLYK